MAYFAMIGVALCVAMLLIAVSVMNGFLHKIEVAAKGLFGDIVVEPSSYSGMGYYDEFIADVLAKCLYGLVIYKIARMKSAIDDPAFEVQEFDEAPSSELAKA